MIIGDEIEEIVLDSNLEQQITNAIDSRFLLQLWRMDAIETRELAGKKAKLAVAELAKLSRRVCDNKEGWSFIPFVTTKLDNVKAKFGWYALDSRNCDEIRILMTFLTALMASNFTAMSSVGSFVAPNGLVMDKKLSSSSNRLSSLASIY
ncbi:E3 ubiquitin-protein ligase UPL6-like [Gossypium australe]|uniref:E3 ubiquitin-protein ligase UPL6-like n=1 Tax=Gossypium australe TaxID=47621 RepID=A0A5B6UB87_9ROSI|nr:E3 ubiquitin-protein ligase UPL6-like [Gossypium australe]